MNLNDLIYNDNICRILHKTFQTSSPLDILWLLELHLPEDTSLPAAGLEFLFTRRIS